TMADNRTMAQLLEATTEGYEDAIVIPEITANNFEIKHGLLKNLVQNSYIYHPAATSYKYNFMTELWSYNYHNLQLIKMMLLDLMTELAH
ncbi:hypothetical protein Tco_0166711, partial [Tanacetum coccineum]